jgi:putative membrane protein
VSHAYGLFLYIYRMNFLLKICLSTVAILLTAIFLPGVTIENNSVLIAFMTALVLAFFNAVLKPVIVIFTLPATIVTFGLFLVAINAFLILLADKLIDGFEVKSFWWAVACSIVLSFITSVLEWFKRDNEKSSKS